MYRLHKCFIIINRTKVYIYIERERENSSFMLFVVGFYVVFCISTLLTI